MHTDDLVVDTNTALGAVLDRVVRKANLIDLVDFYLGSRVDYDANIVSVYFTKEADSAQLEELKDMVELDDFEVRLESDEEDTTIGWVLHLKEKVSGDVAAGGEVQVDVPLSGEIPVNSKERAPEGELE